MASPDLERWVGRGGGIELKRTGRLPPSEPRYDSLKPNLTPRQASFDSQTRVFRARVAGFPRETSCRGEGS